MNENTHPFTVVMGGKKVSDKTLVIDNLINKCLQDKDSCAKMIFVIGPEGGIAPREEDLLISYGYIPVTLGNRIMRVETAAIYIASIINFCSS